MKIPLLIMAAILLPAICSADDGAVMYNLNSGTVMLFHSTAIQMVEEDVTYTYKKDVFQTKFLFKNISNERQKVTVGFPVIGDVDRLLKGQDDELKELSVEEKERFIEKYYNFKSEVDGTTIPRKLISGSKLDGSSEYKYYFVSDLVFEPHQVRTVVDTYDYSPERIESGHGASSETISYILKTGSTWTGVIEKATITINFPSSVEPHCYFEPNFFGRFFAETIEGQPANYTIEKDDKQMSLVWKFSNFKPDFDIEAVHKRDDYGGLNQGFALSEPILLAAIDSAFGRKIESRYEVHIENFFDLLSEDFLIKTYIPAIISYAEQTDLRSLDKTEISNRLQMIRFGVNTISAIAGYTFKSPEWTAFYRNFDWYVPRNRMRKLSNTELILDEKLTMLRDKFEKTLTVTALHSRLALATDTQNSKRTRSTFNEIGWSVCDNDKYRCEATNKSWQYRYDKLDFTASLSSVLELKAIFNKSEIELINRITNNSMEDDELNVVLVSEDDCVLFNISSLNSEGFKADKFQGRVYTVFKKISADEADVLRKNSPCRLSQLGWRCAK